MPKYFLPSLSGYKKSYIKNDLIAGVVVAALTIPVAMGYAEVAGLPPVYGLYASILPVLGYALFASSPQLIYGIDAAASAITATMLGMMGVAAGSDQVLSLAPVLTFFTAVFLILFSVLKLGRFASFISMPVMSGFISGTAVSIILGQIPKVMGLSADGTDFFGNLGVIFGQITKTNWIALVMGVVTAAIVLLGKKFLPKLPTALIVLVLGTALTALLQLDQYGVVITGTIPQGFPMPSLPGFGDVTNWGVAIGGGLVIAIVIFADSLLTTNSFAMQGNYKVRDNQELFAFGISNMAATLVGSSPTSASVSRTAASAQFKGKSQIVSVVAALVVTLVVLFLAGLLYYMPQPLLSGIIIAALVGVVDIDVVKMLAKRSRMELVIWLASALGVLVIGILAGVIIGVVLSFVDVLIRVTAPPQAYLGVIDGLDGYYDLARNPKAHPARDDVIIYRFTATLFFANIKEFKKGVMDAAKQKPKAIIVDASGISGIDVTAAQGMKEIVDTLKKDNIEFYFAEGIYKVTSQLAQMGLKDFVGSDHTPKTVEEALKLVPQGG